MSLTPNKRATEIRFRGGTRGIKIEFQFDHDTLAKVRTLYGRKYHDTPTGRFWTAPLTVDYIRKLVEWGFTIDTSLSECLNPPSFRYNGVPHIPGLKGTLFPFQGEGVAFLEHRKGRAIIGDDMGLGKTVQAAAWLQLHRELRPVVIVAPASLKLMWADILQTWMPNPNVQVLYGFNTDQKITGDILIANYEIVARRLSQLASLGPKVLIIDEIHNIMHSTAKQTKAVIMLGLRCPYVIGLGGTLILNRPMEGYNALHLIDPSIIPASRFDFGMRYCGGYHNGFGWVFDGASNTEELYRSLRKVMIRRLKSEVMPQLPAKLRSVVPLDITNRDDYENAEQDFIGWIRDKRGPNAAIRASNAEAFTRVELLKQIAAKGKMNAVKDWITEFLETANKLVVFVTHHATVDYLTKAFPDISVKLVGGMSAEDTQRVVRSFQQNDDVRLLIGMLDQRGRPAGVGHTLTAAHSTAFIEMPWSPAICDQAEDRVHRIGQTADSVNAYYLVATNTIEVKIAKIIDKKRKVVNSVVDGTTTPEETLLVELLNGYTA